MRKWRTYRLGEIATVTMGQSPRGSSYNRNHEGLPLLNGPTEFGDKYPTPLQWTTETTKLANPGDILVCVRGNTLGRTNIANDVYCIGRGLAAIRSSEDRSHQEFLEIQIQFLATELLKRSAGSTFPSISSAQIKDFEIITPPLAEQLRIAAEVRSQLADIEEFKLASKSRQNAVQALRRSIEHNEFHVDPISIGVPPTSPPCGWRWRRLTDLARLESGHTPSRKRPDWWGGDIPWIALPDIRALDGRVAMETARNTNEEGIANSSARVLPVDTIVVSRDVVVGFATILGNPMATSQHFVNWICGAEIEPRFLLHAFRASKDYLASQASGAIHQTLYMPAVKDFHLCLPDLPEQRRIAAALDESLAAQQTLLDASRRELAAIEALPAAILREIFTDAA